MAYYGRMILASVDRTLLEAIIYGNVALERRSNQKLERHLRSLWTQSSRQPSIYMQLFVSTNGLSPTPTEIERLCVLMETHLSSTGNTYVREVGDIFNNNSATARRSANKDYQAYTWTEQVDHTKEGFQSGKTGKQQYSWMESSDRVKNVRTFLKSLRERLAAIPKAEWYKPLEHPLVEYGYADDSPTRLKQHARHSSSNYIMNLMEAVAYWALRKKQIQTKYRMEQCVIYLIWQRPQAHLSEIIWTSLGEGYIYNGGGFSHYPAGRSNESIWIRSEKEMEDAYAYMRKHSSLLDNLNFDVARIEKQNDDLAANIKAAEDATGASKLVKSNVLVAKHKEMQAKVLENLKRREAALNDSRRFSYESRFARVEVELLEMQIRTEKSKKLQEMMAPLKDPEFRK
jgi:hypothetical protein